MKQMCLLAFLLVAAVGLIIGATTTEVWAAEWEDAEVFFELNDTDGDPGIHAKIDGGHMGDASLRRRNNSYRL